MVVGPFRLGMCGVFTNEYYLPGSIRANLDPFPKPTSPENHTQ